MPKLPQNEFDELVAQIRSGCERAASTLVKLYEPEIRREVRLRLTDRHLRRTLDSTDICQSVLGNFFVRATMGQIDFDRPEQLLRLLSRMVRNKVIDRHRRESVRRPKDGHNIAFGEMANDFQPTDAQQSPSEIVANEELLSKVQTSLSDQEMQIARLRREGLSWDEIAIQLESSAEALRKRLTRACTRVISEFDL